MKDEDKLLIDNAATASQNSTLVDDPVTVEAIRMNIINPLRKEALIESSKLRRVIQATHKNPVKHVNCEETNCYICDGGLFVCADCGAAEIEAEERVCTGSGVSQNFIKIPKTWAEAETMQKLGFAWLEANAPERLTDISKSLSEANAENERLRKALVDMLPPKLDWREADADGYYVHHKASAIRDARAALLTPSKEDKT